MTTPKPAWRVLPFTMVVMAGLLTIVDRIALPPSMRTLVQMLVTSGGFTCIGLWIRWNRAAIALEEWGGRNEGSGDRAPSTAMSDPREVAENPSWT